VAKKTIRVSDRSGAEIPEGKGATVRITFADARKGVRELDLTDAEAEQLGVAPLPGGVAVPRTRALLRLAGKAAGLPYPPDCSINSIR
jgi:hypothetical protein